jgi:phage terminase Nu1 subunit (DNA packaging protein)
MATKKKKASNRKAQGAKPTKKKTAQKKAQRTNWTKPTDWLTQSEAAALCRVSVTMFQRYELKPAERRGRYTYYTRDQVLDHIEQRAHRKGYEAGFRDGKNAAPEDAGDLMEAKERAELDWTKERAEGQRLKNAAMRRELAPVKMVTWAISQAGGQIAAALGTLKGKIKRAQPELGNEALQEIEQVVVEGQNAAADIKLDWDEFDESDLADPRVH